MRVLRHVSWALPLALGAAVLTLGIARPWVGSYDANGARESTAARNHLRHGLAATRGGQVVNAGRLTPDRFRFYAHHPSGLSLTLAASFAVCGQHEWSARLVPILFTLAATALLCLVARELAGPWGGLCAGLVFAAQPMVAFYGRMPDHEAPAACFALLLTWLYLRWRDDPRGSTLAAMAVAAFVGVWFAWVAAAVPWLLLGYHWLVSRKGRRAMALPAVAATLGFLGVLGHVALIQGGLGELWGALSHRLGSQAGDRTVEGTLTVATFLQRQGAYFWTCFSALASALSVLSVLSALRGSRRPAGLLVLVLALWALLNILGFRQGAYVHIYYQFYLAIPIALGAGLGLGALATGRPRRWPVVAALALTAAIGAEGWTKLQAIRSVEIPNYREQQDLAAHVERATRPDDRILLVWDGRASFSQLTWYADRDITVVPTEPEADRRLGQGAFDVRIRYLGPRLGCRVERLTPQGGARLRAPDR